MTLKLLVDPKTGQDNHNTERHYSDNYYHPEGREISPLITIMPGKEFNIVAVLYPKKGKADQLVEMLQEVAQYVRDNEAGTLK